VDGLLLSTIECTGCGGLYFCQLLNVQGVEDLRQTEIETAGPFVPEPSISEVEVAVGKLKRNKSPGADQIPAEIIEAGGGGNITI
jgi:hypothetical protein